MNVLALALRPRSLASLAAVLACAALPATAFAAAPTKEQCVASHGLGQDLREKGQLVQARKTFLACAQASCPGVVQADCARFSDEIERITPSVSFAARDAKGADLPAASVYVDDQLVATRLDDGKSYDIDPGRHVVRFVQEGSETTLKIVLAQGEKGRTVLGTFADLHGDVSKPAAKSVASSAPPPAPEQPETHRPILPLVVSLAGGAALVTGVVLIVVGTTSVPSSCSLSSKECSAAPKDPAFDDARSAVMLSNLGIGVAAAGAAVGLGGLIWYLASPAQGKNASGTTASGSRFGRNAGFSPTYTNGPGIQYVTPF